MKTSRIRAYARLTARVGANVQPGQGAVIYTQPEGCEFARMVAEELYLAGAGWVDVLYQDQTVEKLGYQYQKLSTLSRVPAYLRERQRFFNRELPCEIHIICEDPDGLNGVDQQVLAQVRQKRGRIIKPLRDVRENRNQWTIVDIPNAAWAKKVFPGLPEKKAVASIHQSGRDPKGCDQCILLIQRFMEELSSSALPEDPEALASLRRCSCSRSVSPLPSSQQNEKTEELFGRYLITDGEFCPYLEVAPNNSDFWYLFHDRSLAPNAVTVEIRPMNSALLLTVNRDRKFLCGTGGRWIVQDVKSPLEGITRVACCAEYLEDGSIHAVIKWLNGWSVSDIVLTRGERKGDMLLTNTKDMLHEYLPPVVHACRCRKVTL